MNKVNFHVILMPLSNSDKDWKEHFLTGRGNATSTWYLVNLEKKNKHSIISIANAILSSLAENNIDVAFAKGQAYDHCTAAMSSEACSVQGSKKIIAPTALCALMLQSRFKFQYCSRARC